MAMDCVLFYFIILENSTVRSMGGQQKCALTGKSALLPVRKLLSSVHWADKKDYIIYSLYVVIVMLVELLRFGSLFANGFRIQSLHFFLSNNLFIQTT